MGMTQTSTQASGTRTSYMVELRTDHGWTKVKGYTTKEKALASLRANADTIPGWAWRVRTGCGEIIATRG